MIAAQPEASSSAPLATSTGPCELALANAPITASPRHPFSVSVLWTRVGFTELLAYTIGYEATHAWALWEGCGLAYDSTLGYADRTGFRAGTCFPYRPWLLDAAREARCLVSFPAVSAHERTVELYVAVPISMINVLSGWAILSGAEMGGALPLDMLYSFFAIRSRASASACSFVRSRASRFPMRPA